jgi:hypothetical protein
MRRDSHHRALDAVLAHGGEGQEGENSDLDFHSPEGELGEGKYHSGYPVKPQQAQYNPDSGTCQRNRIITILSAICRNPADLSFFAFLPCPALFFSETCRIVPLFVLR